MYVAVKGGERAIENAHRLLAHERRGDPAVPELTTEQIDGQLSLAVDRVMNEGSLYDRELAALAIKQARGDLIEAAANLFSHLRALDAAGSSAIAVMPVPPIGLGEAINDRLRRAAAK